MNKRAAPSIAIEAIILAARSPLSRDAIYGQLSRAVKRLMGTRSMPCYLRTLHRDNRISRSGSLGSYTYHRPKASAVKAEVKAEVKVKPETGFRLQLAWRGVQMNDTMLDAN